ncbi:MAG: acyl-CoA dehydrogenase, partial [Bacteroidota bacterium]
QDFDSESIDFILDSAKDLADKEFFPYYQEMDEKPAKFEDGEITVHPQVKNVIQKSAEIGMIGATFDYEHGGMQLPWMASMGAGYILTAANNPLVMYAGLTAGAAHLITSFGTEEQIEKYVPKMLGGEWGGTMCLTEPQAGSSLSDITSTAYPQSDGSYKIVGQKIFISSGDHQCVDNIVHLFLARIEGAPKGTKGISLFVVPKKRIKADGTLESNDVKAAGDFQKLGQRANATAHLSFGENNDCYGWLVGDENRGLAHMFQMMNGARIEVGMNGAAIASAAYEASLQYAKERPQGRSLSRDGQKDVNKGQTTIINHPDVRRMLLLQKAVTEGSLSLLMETGRLLDLKHTTEGKEQANNHLLLELLTPIAKTYPSEMGRISVSTGLQVLGGYGFCLDFPLQQYYRDIRIMSLYEGTTGIQSLDLLGRKATVKNGKALMLLMGEVQQAIQDANTYDDLKPYAKTLAKKMQEVQEVMQHLVGFAMKGEFEKFLADATIFMEFASTIVIGWQWLKMATKAKEALVTGNMTQPVEFYESKVHTMKFFYKYEMPKTASAKEVLLNTEFLTITKQEKELIM